MVTRLRPVSAGVPQLTKTCSIEGCGKTVCARGWCVRHYECWKRNGSPTAFQRVARYPDDAECSVDGCCEKPTDRNMCGKHAQRVRRYGDPHYLTPEDVRRANNRAAQPKLGKCANSTYPKFFGRHKHRAEMERALGRSLQQGEVIHHIDGNKQNNDLDNLMVMSQREHIRLHRDEMQRAK